MPADCLDPRPLGSSGIEVSALSLGSWRTYERLPAPLSAAIMRAAREEGITFFDDARYNDETGRAPIPTGCSQVVFGNVFRAAGLRRDEVVLANKLWWEFWPGQSAAADHIGQGQNVGRAELAGSVDQRGRWHGCQPGHPAAIRRPAPIQPGPPVSRITR